MRRFSEDVEVSLGKANSCGGGSEGRRLALAYHENLRKAKSCFRASLNMAGLTQAVTTSNVIHEISRSVFVFISSPSTSIGLYNFPRGGEFHWRMLCSVKKWSYLSLWHLDHLEGIWKWDCHLSGFFLFFSSALMGTEFSQKQIQWKDVHTQKRASISWKDGISYIRMCECTQPEKWVQWTVDKTAIHLIAAPTTTPITNSTMCWSWTKRLDSPETYKRNKTM